MSDRRVANDVGARARPLPSYQHQNIVGRRDLSIVYGVLFAAHLMSTSVSYKQF
jgi:hypothetical protein